MPNRATPRRPAIDSPESTAPRELAEVIHVTHCQTEDDAGVRCGYLFRVRGLTDRYAVKLRCPWCGCETTW